jgi:hypothetical protein
LAVSVNLLDNSNHEIVSLTRNHLTAPLDFLGENQGKLLTHKARFRNGDTASFVVEFNQTAATRRTIRPAINGGEYCETPSHQLLTQTPYCD